VLVTGCSSGIGRATALALVQAGFPVWASARQPDRLGELADAGCRVLDLDVTDEQSAASAVARIEAEHGAVGVLVNNAGHGGGGPVEEVPLDFVRESFDTNVFGLIRLVQLVLPGMRAQRSGVIVNLGSAAGLVTPPTGCPYAMTKYALESLSDALRPEVAPFGIRVVLIEPGAVATPIWGKSIAAAEALQDDAPPEAQELYSEVIDAIRAQSEKNAVEGVPPQEVAEAVAHALTATKPKTRYLVGRDAKMRAPMAKVLPDRVLDAAIARALGQRKPS